MVTAQLKVITAAAAIALTLASGCALHGPNITFDLTVDKRDQRQWCEGEVEQQQLGLSREEVQELLSYAKMAVDLAREGVEIVKSDDLLRSPVTGSSPYGLLRVLGIIDPQTSLEVDVSDPLFE
jgi:hypothetical protein